MTFWFWRKRIAEADNAVHAAEERLAHAEQQQRRAEALAPRVDAVTSSLRKLHRDNHFGPMIDKALRGNE